MNYFTLLIISNLVFTVDFMCDYNMYRRNNTTVTPLCSYITLCIQDLSRHDGDISENNPFCKDKKKYILILLFPPFTVHA